MKIENYGVLLEKPHNLERLAAQHSLRPNENSERPGSPFQIIEIWGVHITGNISINGQEQPRPLLEVGQTHVKVRSLRLQPQKSSSTASIRHPGPPRRLVRPSPTSPPWEPQSLILP